MRRIAALVLALLAPLLGLGVLAAPAQAVYDLPYTDYGPSASGTAKIERQGPYNDTVCSLAARWVVTWVSDPAVVGPNLNTAYLRGSGVCSDDVVAPEGSVKIKVDGGDCQVVIDATIGAGGFTFNEQVSPTGACDVTSGIASFGAGCVDADYSPGSGNWLMVDCDVQFVWSLGPIPPFNGVVEGPPATTCPEGEPTGVNNLINSKPPGGWFEWMVDVATRTRVAARYGVVFVVRRPGGQLYAGTPTGEGVARTFDRPVGEGINAKVTTGGFNGTSYPDAFGATMVGVQIFVSKDNVAPWNTWRDFTKVPQDKVGGDLGLTRPSSCMWYFGAKIANLAAVVDDTEGEATADPYSTVTGGTPTPPTEPVDPPPVASPVAPEPTAPVDTNPDGSDVDGCGDGFSWKNPLTWAGATLGSVACILMVAVKVLGQIVKAIGGLAAGIVGALSGILEGLFIPNPGGWGFDDLKAQTEDRPPFSVAGDLADTGAAVQSAYSGGEGSTSAQFNIAGESHTIGAPSIPGYSALYALVQALLLSLTGFSIFNMFTNVIERGQ